MQRRFRFRFRRVRAERDDRDAASAYVKVSVGLLRWRSAEKQRRFCVASEKSASSWALSTFMLRCAGCKCRDLDLERDLDLLRGFAEFESAE